jgi:ATP-dependent 26S proteasome regulatory subunit
VPDINGYPKFKEKKILIIHCTNCFAEYDVNEDMLGKKASCEKCNATFRISNDQITLKLNQKKCAKGSGEAFLEQLDLFIRARYTFIHIITTEEERVLNVIQKLSSFKQRNIITWDFNIGFSLLYGDKNKGILPKQTADPIEALDNISELTGEYVIVLKDFHVFLENLTVLRKLKSLTQNLKYQKITLLLTAPVRNLPVEIVDECVSLELNLPSAGDLEEVLDELLLNPKVENNLSFSEKERIIQASIGLTYSQAQRVFSKAIVSNGRVSIDNLELIIAEKKQIIKASGALEYYGASENLSNVGGLHALKKWLNIRTEAFSSEAAEYGLPTPKGIALIGIPGTGKSLTAKAIAGIWKMPLIRMDVGALFGSYVGETEANTRQAISLAETIAPCILWIDEIEKSLNQNLGSELSGRLMATILSWMQEKTKPVFVVATANNIEEVPPELLRKGRFDEIFFLDLPNLEERNEIFKIQLQKRKRNYKNYDIERLAIESEGFVGAEIEQAVVDAMFSAFSDSPRREINTEDISLALKELIPLSNSNKERIDYLRSWLKEGRAKSATFLTQDDAVKRFVLIEVDKS